MKLTCPRRPANPARGIALALLVTTSLSIAALGAVPAHAQAAVSFDIAAGPLPTVLNQFARQAHVELIYDAPLTQSATSPGLKGSFGAAEGLSRILAGSGLTYRQTGPNVFTLEYAPAATASTVQLGPVRVVGATDELASLYPGDPHAASVNPPTTVASKIPLRQREIPHTIAVKTQQEIQQRNLQSLDEVLKVTPGVFVLQSDADRVQYYSRGFPITTMVVDGLPVVMNSDMSATASTNSPNLAMYDRVEVLDGPIGLFGGFGSAGGVLSLVRKRAPDHFQGLFDIAIGTRRNVLGTIDLGGPLNAAGSVRARLVANAQTKNLDQRGTWRHDQSYYGTIEADLGEKTLLRAGVGYSRRDSNVGWANQIPLYTDESLAGGRSDFFGAPWNHDRYAGTNVFASLEQGVSDTWKIVLAGSFDHKTARVLSGELFGQVDTATNIATFGTTNTDYYENNQSYDVIASGKYHLFGRDHDATIGFNYSHMYNYGTSYYGEGNLFNFEDVDIRNYSFAKPSWTGLPAYTSKGTTIETQYGAYGSTRIHLTETLTAVGGARLAWWDTSFKTDPVYNPFGYAPSNGHYHAKLTPYGGLIWDFARSHSLYFSYAETFQAQTLRDPAGNLIAPMEGEQYEAGIKGEYLDGRLQASVALFQLTQKNRALPTDATYQYFTAAGRARSRGVDVRVSGEIRPGWSISAGYTYDVSKYLDADSLDVSASSLTQIAPKHLFKLWTNYRLPESVGPLEIGAGINATSALYGGSGTETIRQDAFFTADARIAYRIRNSFSVDVNITNIFDKTYFTPLTPYQGVVFGLSRRMTVSLRGAF